MILKTKWIKGVCSFSFIPKKLLVFKRYGKNNNRFGGSRQTFFFWGGQKRDDFFLRKAKLTLAIERFTTSLSLEKWNGNQWVGMPSGFFWQGKCWMDFKNFKSDLSRPRNARYHKMVVWKMHIYIYIKLQKKMVILGYRIVRFYLSRVQTLLDGHMLHTNHTFGEGSRSWSKYVTNVTTIQ